MICFSNKKECFFVAFFIATISGGGIRMYLKTVSCYADNVKIHEGFKVRVISGLIRVYPFLRDYFIEDMNIEEVIIFDAKVKSLTNKTQSKSYAIKEPKSTSSIRNIQVGKNLEMYLNKYKEKQSKIPGFNEEWFMFGNLKPLSSTTITREKDRAIKKSGVKRISIHDFRHSHASNLIANGINIVAVSKRLGHSNVEMTLRVYTHLIKTTEDQLLSYIDESSQNLLTK